MVNYELRRRFGIRLAWNSRQEQQEVVRYSRKLWKEYKKQNGISESTPVNQIPGFLDSIEQLGLQGHSFADIGAMFGLSHQRIKIYFEEHNLQSNKSTYRGTGHGAMARIWSNRKRRFVALNEGDLEKVLRERNEIAKEEKRQARRSEHVLLIKNFKKREGRPPTTKELVRLVYGVENTGYLSGIAAFWGYDYAGQGLSISRALDKLYGSARCSKRAMQGGKLRKIA